jgi:hypothetical protein
MNKFEINLSIKSLTFVAAALLLSIVTLAQPKPESPGKKPIITFDKNTYDFGDLVQGEQVTYTYKFRNTGKSMLIVSDAKATCGCTIPKWTKDPVAPGKSGEITVTFNTAGKMGKQNKVILLFSNAFNQEEKIHLIANVIPPPKAEEVVPEQPKAD